MPCCDSVSPRGLQPSTSSVSSPSMSSPPRAAAIVRRAGRAWPSAPARGRPTPMCRLKPSPTSEIAIFACSSVAACRTRSRQRRGDLDLGTDRWRSTTASVVRHEETDPPRPCHGLPTQHASSSARCLPSKSPRRRSREVADALNLHPGSFFGRTSPLVDPRTQS